MQNPHSVVISLTSRFHIDDFLCMCALMASVVRGVCVHLGSCHELMAAPRLLPMGSFVFTLEPLGLPAEDHSGNPRQLPVFVSEHLLFVHKDNSIFSSFPSLTFPLPLSPSLQMKRYTNRDNFTKALRRPLSTLLTVAVKQSAEGMKIRGRD